jgi:molecular chaperone DnaJ
VKGKGVVTPKSSGDLIVTVDVVVPKSLNDEQRDALERFARATNESTRTESVKADRAAKS